MLGSAAVLDTYLMLLPFYALLDTAASTWCCMDVHLLGAAALLCTCLVLLFGCAPAW